MSIDWTKAPEGANKAGFTGPDNYLQFYRIPGRFGDYDYWSEKGGGAVITSRPAQITYLSAQQRLNGAARACRRLGRCA